MGCAGSRSAKNASDRLNTKYAGPPLLLPYVISHDIVIFQDNLLVGLSNRNVNVVTQINDPYETWARCWGFFF